MHGWIGYEDADEFARGVLKGISWIGPADVLLTGTVQNDGDGNVTGVGTLFTTELAVNDVVHIRDAGADHEDIARVVSIASDTSMVIASLHKLNQPHDFGKFASEGDKAILKAACLTEAYHILFSLGIDNNPEAQTMLAIEIFNGWTLPDESVKSESYSGVSRVYGARQILPASVMRFADVTTQMNFGVRLKDRDGNDV